MSSGLSSTSQLNFDKLYNDKRIKEVSLALADPAREIDIKLEILHAFLDVYAYLIGYHGFQSPRKVTKTCVQVYHAYLPIIKKLPKHF